MQHAACRPRAAVGRQPPIHSTPLHPSLCLSRLIAPSPPPTPGRLTRSLPPFETPMVRLSRSACYFPLPTARGKVACSLCSLYFAPRWLSWRYAAPRHALASSATGPEMDFPPRALGGIYIRGKVLLYVRTFLGVRRGVSLTAAARRKQGRRQVRIQGNEDVVHKTGDGGRPVGLYSGM